MLEAEAAWHRSRRMFAIVRGQLEIAPNNTSESHRQWFTRVGWIPAPRSEKFESIPRGYVDQGGDVYFYIGSGMEDTIEVREAVRRILPELIQKLGLKTTGHIYGGVVTASLGAQWRGINDYGAVSDCLTSLQSEE